MNVPTWLYCKDGSAEIVRDQAKYEARIAEGWKDSPARFTEEAAEKEAAEKEAAITTQSPTVPPPAPVEKKPAPAKKKPVAVANKKDSSADDLI